MPGVNTTGAAPPSRNRPTSSGSGVTSRSSYSGKPVSTVCAGQSGWRGPNHSGNSPITPSGEWNQSRRIPLTGCFKPSSARKVFSGGATNGSITRLSPTSKIPRLTHRGSHLGSHRPGYLAVS